MKQFFLSVIFFIAHFISGQTVLEYYVDSETTFQVYTKDNNKLKKIINASEFSSSVPEDLVRSYFFATSNEILSDLYLDKEQFTPKEENHFDNINKTSVDEMYVQLLHKSNYSREGKDICSIMFIAKIKDIDFPFPTLLTMIKKNEKWYIHRQSNQQKYRDCLMMFKPCVLSNLIAQESDDPEIQNLISKSKSNTGHLDYSLLFDELVRIQNDEKLSTKLTMSQNMDCSQIKFRNLIKEKTTLTAIFKNLNISKIKKQDSVVISQLKKNNDSIILKSRLEFEYANDQYRSIKFDRIKDDGTVIKDFARLDQNTISENPIKELLTLYQELKTEVFSDLSPSMSKKPIMESKLYKESRGVYEVLNISKLYNLYLKDKAVFGNYIE